MAIMNNDAERALAEASGPEMEEVGVPVVGLTVPAGVVAVLGVLEGAALGVAALGVAALGVAVGVAALGVGVVVEGVVETAGPSLRMNGDWLA